MAVTVPEPDMTPARLWDRAIAMRGLLRDGQDKADERGAYSPEVHVAFLKSGFYRVTQPRMFGGYEFDLKTNYRLFVEISRGHPRAGWCLSLAESHAYVVGLHWPEKVQRELFGSDGLAQQAGGLARHAVELLFQNSRSAPTKKRSRLARYFGDVAMYGSHVSSLRNNQATFVARAHFGRPTGFRGL